MKLALPVSKVRLGEPPNFSIKRTVKQTERIMIVLRTYTIASLELHCGAGGRGGGGGTEVVAAACVEGADDTEGR
jgi:hypothetical protein